MLDLLHHFYPALTAGGVGLLLIFWPPPKQAAAEEARQKRLAELRAGAEERHFEERRELEALWDRAAQARSAFGAA